jgi:hypothetical protein
VLCVSEFDNDMYQIRLQSEVSVLGFIVLPG